MKYFKQSVLLVVFLLGISFFHNVRADIAPNIPSHRYMDLSVRIGLGSFSDRLVLIAESSDHHGFGRSFEVISDPYVSTDPSDGDYTSYFALDKKYFEESGGIEGLFITKNSEGEGDYMEPRNPDQFNGHKYNFLVSKDDPDLLKFDTYTGNLIDNKYVDLPFGPNLSYRLGPDNPNCETSWPDDGCKVAGTKTVTFVAQSLYCSKNICNKLIFFNSNQIIQKHSVWQRFWQWLKSIF